MLSPPFSTKLCNFRRSHDIDVVDRYSDFAISLSITTDVGGLKGFIGIDDIIGDVGVLGTVGGVPYSEMQLVILQFLMLGSVM